MAKLSEEEKIDKKTKQELDSYVDNLKKDLLKEVNEQIDVKVSLRMKEEEKRILKGKKAKIIRRDLLIIILIAIIGYFSYCLYDCDYFNIKTIVIEENNGDINTNNDNTEEIVYDSAYYIENYGYLVDNLQINDSSIYDLYNNNLSNEVLLKIAYKNLSDSDITISDNVISFKSISIEDAINNIFGDITIAHETFTYNNTTFIYYSDTYIGLSNDTKDINLVYQITDATGDDNTITFTIIVGVISGNKLLNLNDDVVCKDYNNEDILDYQKKLSQYEITFKDNIFDSIHEV